MKSIRELIDILEDGPMTTAVNQQVAQGRKTKSGDAPQHPLEIGKTKYNQDFAKPGDYTPTMAEPEPEQDYPTAPTKFAPPPAELPQGAQAAPADTRTSPDLINRASQLQPHPQVPAQVANPAHPIHKATTEYGKRLNKNEIADIQSMLVQLGYNIGKSGTEGNGVDGVWGPATEKAFKTAYSQMYGQQLKESITPPSNLKEYMQLVEAETDYSADLAKSAERLSSIGQKLRHPIDTLIQKFKSFKPYYDRAEAEWNGTEKPTTVATTTSTDQQAPTQAQAEPKTAPQGSAATTTPAAAPGSTSWPKTKEEVVAFQKAHNLTPDGLIGWRTTAALKQAGAVPPQGFVPVADKPGARTSAAASTTPAEPEAKPGYYINKQGQEVPSNFDPNTGKVIGMPPPLKPQQGASTTPAAQQPNIHQQMRNLAKTDPDVAATRQAFKESAELEDILKLAKLK